MKPKPKKPTTLNVLMDRWLEAWDLNLKQLRSLGMKRVTKERRKDDSP